VETENFGSELAQTISADFMTATDINYAMGRLYTAVVQNRIPIRSANALGTSATCPARRRSLPGEATSTIPTPRKPVIPSEERNLSSPLTSVAPSQLTAAESGETSTADATGQ
jgi:hypothetical protein